MEHTQTGDFGRSGAVKRMLSLVLAFVMLLSLLPATSLFTLAQAAATQTVYFRDINNWGSVYGYAWDDNGKQLLGEWPGTRLSKDSNGLYKMTVSVSGSLNFIFNNGVGGTGNQTSNLNLSAAQLSAGLTYTVDGTNGFPVTAGGPVIVGNSVTFTYVGDASSVLVAGTMNDWAGVAMYDVGDYFTYTLRLDAGTYEYKFVVDGNWVTDSSNPNVIGADKNSYFVVTADSAKMDYEANLLKLKVTAPVTASEVSLVRADGSAADVRISGFSYSAEDSTCTLNLSRLVMLEELPNLRVRVNASEYVIEPDGYIFYSDRFHQDYTYNGNDLGATWTENGTTFKAWAPTAWDVKLIRYSAGNGNFDSQGYDKTWIEEIDMVRGDKGVWTVTVPGDLHGTYYNYKVTFPHKTNEAVDPYANSTGIDGYRSMVLNMDATDPEGWDNDVSPNQGMAYTDAIIYEMHIREYTVHSTSGVKDEWKGKYLGLTQTGTTYQGYATGLDHLKELGVTHVQIMPFNDFEASISETDSATSGEGLYGWGYNPKNFNTPEGSYSTNPYDGEVRVNELKQMIQALHSSGINVIMDSVYNHVSDGGGFSYNRLVPSYFSRFHGANDDWSRENHCNSSGCGNDFATQRAMARKYIVDSILYWVEEYHVDGFRFDLAGLIDAETMNEAISTVHEKYPHVIFYGEGWEKTDSNMEGATPVSQYFASQVPEFAFFNHVMRDSAVGGEHEASDEWGFGMGNSMRAETVMNSMRAINWGWANGWEGAMENPNQVINYVACHDKYTLTDKIWYKTHDEISGRSDFTWEWYAAAANRLTNTVILLSQGIPLMYSGDELLRQKTKEEDGWPAHNSGHEKHNDGSDFTNAELDKLNAFDWSNLADVQYADVTNDYYAGLIEFRKNHAALRCNDYTNGTPDSKLYTSSYRISDQCIMIYVDGTPNNECSDGILMILNSGTNTQWVNYYDYGIPQGNWQACIHGDQAGVEALWSTTSGSVGVDPCSATVLVLGDLIDENSVYNRQGTTDVCYHTNHDQNGNCTNCGTSVGHSYVSNTCTVCGKLLPGSDTTKTIYVDVTGSSWNNVNVYAWAGNVACTGQWPGAKMTKVSGNIYSYEVPGSAVNIIFNNGTSQTDDLTIPADGKNLYSYATGAWSTYSTACSHSYTSKVTTAATCTTNGVKTFTCTKCGNVYTVTFAANGHSYASKVTTAATCTSNGVKTYTCSACGDSYTEVIAASGHKYSNSKCTVCGNVDPNCSHSYTSKVTTSPTCTATGLRTYTCTKCGDVYNETIAANGHKFVDTVVPPTCELNGYTTHKCSVCGVSNPNTDVVNPIGHDYSKYVVTAPTCTEQGYTTYTCQNCGNVKVWDYTNASGHSYVSGSCSTCGAKDPNYVVPGSTNYYLVGWINGADYGCESDYENMGVYQFVDGKLTAKFTEDSYIFVKTEGNGKWLLTESYCTDSTATFIEGGADKMFVPGGVELIFTLVENADGSVTVSYTKAGAAPCSHSYTAKVTTAATCISTGIKTYTCSKCSSVYTEVIPVTDHNYVSGVCTTCGGSDGSLTPAATYYLVGWINGADHGCESDWENNGDYKFVNGQLTATFTEDSYVFVKTEGNGKWLLSDSYCTDSTCTFRDSGTEKMFIPGGVQLFFSIVENEDGSVTVSYTKGGTTSCDHSYTAEVTTEATCTTTGLRTYTCTKCSHSYTQPIAANGHNFFGGSCSVCGIADPNGTPTTGTSYYLVGYINGADHGCEADWQNLGSYKFVNGKLTVKFTQNSYVFVKTGDNKDFLLAPAYCEASTCSFAVGNTEKMFVPANVELTFVLTENTDGSVSLTYTSGNTPASTIPTLTLKAPTLEFKDMITINAFYTAENTQDVVEMGMITYTSKVDRWSVRTAEHVVPGATYNESTGRYLSASQGIHAKYLADTFYLATYAKLADGSYVYSKLAPYSPMTYANSQLKNSTDIKLKQLSVAMLNYGAEAQLYFGHNTGNLANAALNAEHLALPESYRADMVASVPTASATKQGSFANNQGFAKRMPSISFEGAFCINYFFTPKYAPDSGITMYYWTEADYNANSVLTTSNATGSIKLSGSGTGEYRGDITGIAAKALSEAVYVACAYKSNGTVWTSGVLGYSIGSYCANQASAGSTIADLAMATAVYGYHAKAYFG